MKTISILPHDYQCIPEYNIYRIDNYRYVYRGMFIVYLHMYISISIHTYICTHIIICIFLLLLFLFWRFSFTFRLPGASQQIYAICLAIYVLYVHTYMYDNWCPHAIFSAFALQTVSDSNGERRERWAVKALALSLMNWNEWEAGVVGYNNTKAFSHTHQCTYVCIHTHTHTHKQTLPRCRLKICWELCEQRSTRRAVGSAAVVSLLRCVFGGVAAAAATLWRSRRYEQRDSCIFFCQKLPTTKM